MFWVNIRRLDVWRTRGLKLAETAFLWTILVLIALLGPFVVGTSVVYAFQGNPLVNKAAQCVNGVVLVVTLIGLADWSIRRLRQEEKDLTDEADPVVSGGSGALNHD